MKLAWIALFCFGMLSSITADKDGDGSKCPNVSCSPPIPGAECKAKYERDDGCCPVWYCTSNGVTSTIYGKSSGGSSSSSSFSSSSNFGGGMPNGGAFPGLNLKLPNLANLFGR